MITDATHEQRANHGAHPSCLSCPSCPPSQFKRRQRPLRAAPRSSRKGGRSATRYGAAEEAEAAAAEGRELREEAEAAAAKGRATAEGGA